VVTSSVHVMMDQERGRKGGMVLRSGSGGTLPGAGPGQARVVPNRLGAGDTAVSRPLAPALGSVSTSPGSERPRTGSRAAQPNHLGDPRRVDEGDSAEVDDDSGIDTPTDRAKKGAGVGEVDLSCQCRDGSVVVTVDAAPASGLVRRVVPTAPTRLGGQRTTSHFSNADQHGGVPATSQTERGSSGPSAGAHESAGARGRAAVRSPSGPPIRRCMRGRDRPYLE
jgi:hypothetical protein